MDATGKIIHIGETQQVSDRFRKRDVVLEIAENPQYPEFVKFEFHQDKCDLLANYGIGQAATIAFNLRGRKWTDRNGEVKYFTTLQGWRIAKADSGTDDAPPPADDIPPVPGRFDDVVDEIPF